MNENVKRAAYESIVHTCWWSFSVIVHPHLNHRLNHSLNSTWPTWPSSSQFGLTPCWGWLQHGHTQGQHAAVTMPLMDETFWTSGLCMYTYSGLARNCCNCTWPWHYLANTASEKSLHVIKRAYQCSALGDWLPDYSGNYLRLISIANLFPALRVCSAAAPQQLKKS